MRIFRRSSGIVKIVISFRIMAPLLLRMTNDQ